MIKRIRRRIRLVIILLIVGTVPAVALLVKQSGLKLANVAVAYMEPVGCESYPAEEEAFTTPEEINENLARIDHDLPGGGLFSAVPVEKTTPVRLSTLQH